MASEPPKLSVGQALQQATRFLSEHGIDSPRLTAEVLLCRALHKERVYLYSHPEAPLPELAWIHFGRWLHERTQGKPLQYITKEQEFYGRPFAVGPGVLIPRPETELIVELGLRNEATAVLDIGTGSGILAMAAAKRWKRRVLATDIEPWSVRVAEQNARMNGVGALVRARLADGWAERHVRAGRSYDLVFANILARPLCAMAKHMAMGLAPGGTAILAGLLGTQARMVLAAHRRQGLVLERALPVGPWTTLVLRKAP